MNNIKNALAKTSNYMKESIGIVILALILACLEQEIYPGWDAHNLASRALAEKLGYHFLREYVSYEIYGK